jgi:hypothetical protein
MNSQNFKKLKKIDVVGFERLYPKYSGGPTKQENTRNTYRGTYFLLQK